MARFLLEVRVSAMRRKQRRGNQSLEGHREGSRDLCQMPGAVAVRRGHKDRVIEGANGEIRAAREDME